MTEEIQTIGSVELPIGERLKIIKNRLDGQKNKRRISIVTGTHGDELEGQYVCYLLNRKIKEESEKLNGIVDVYPALNPMGIDTITRGIPGFDLDMNRTFPGSKDGAVTEQVAYDIVHDLLGSDLVIDIHASNIFLTEMPQARISEETANDLLPFAENLNIDLIWIHAAATVLRSTLAHSINSQNTKTIVVEMGVGMRITKRYGEQLVEGIFNVMKQLEIWQGEPKRLKKPIVCKDEVDFINAPVSGVFLPCVTHLTKVEKGQPIGDILEPLTGNILSRLYARKRGTVFTLREYPIVDEGSLIARILIEGGQNA